jgi:hypothetical protein
MPTPYARLLLRTGFALAALASATYTPGASAQITITESDLLSVYDGPSTQTTFGAELTDTSVFTMVALSVQTGGAQTWDFTDLTFAPTSTYTFAPVTAPAPGSDDAHFAQGNLIVRTDSVGTTDDPGWAYYRLDADELTAYGSALVDDGAVLRTLKFVPGETQPLPYTFGSTWSSASQLVFEPASFPGTLSTRKDGEVVGWGTLVTPAGSEPALMVRTVLVNRSELPGVPASVDSSVVVSYVTEGLTSASVFLDFLGQPTGAVYTTRTDGGTAGEPGTPGGGLRLAPPAPNPASGPVRLSYVLAAPAAVRLSVYDVLGREVAVVAAGERATGEHEASLDTSALPAGVYTVRVEGGGHASTVRLTVVH